MEQQEKGILLPSTAALEDLKAENGIITPPLAYFLLMNMLLVIGLIYMPC